jgi:hypothetical protein
MDDSRFDTLARSLTSSISRRGTLGGALAILGLTASRPGESLAKRRRKKKLRRNAFGCVPVGKPCRGKDSVCCSGICEGKKPKKGKRDRSRCADHGADICQAGQRNVNCGGEDVRCTSSSGNEGTCETTTGGAAYCASGYDAIPCKKDADCVPYCGPQAACVRCGYYDHDPSCAGPEACHEPA